MKPWSWRLLHRPVRVLIVCWERSSLRCVVVLRFLRAGCGVRAGAEPVCAHAIHEARHLSPGHYPEGGHQHQRSSALFLQYDCFGVYYCWSHLCLQTAWWSLISLETSYQTWNWAGRVNRIPLVRFHCHLVGLYPQCAHLSIFATGQAAWLEWQDIWDSVNYYWRYWGRVSPEKGLQGIILIFTSLSAFSIWNWPSYRLYLLP